MRKERERTADVEPLAVLVCRRDAVLRNIRSGRHGNNDVLSLLIVCLRDTEEKLILVNTKFCPLPDLKEGGMLIVFRPNSVSNPV